jgi:long-chain acyl-CoA synthetase
MVMQGLLQRPRGQHGRDILEEDGHRWFRTGDAGTIDDDGHLIYLDRVKDMLTLAGGERFSPQFIEGRLKFSPYVRDVMAVGGETRECATALIIIDYENVGQWAEKQRIPYTTFVDLSQTAAGLRPGARAVEEVNASLPPAARLRASC